MTRVFVAALAVLFAAGAGLVIWAYLHPVRRDQAPEVLPSLPAPSPAPTAIASRPAPPPRRKQTVAKPTKPRRAKRPVRTKRTVTATPKRSPGVYVVLGDAQRERGEYAEAIKSYRRALALDPENFAAISGRERARVLLSLDPSDE